MTRKKIDDELDFSERKGKNTIFLVVISGSFVDIELDLFHALEDEKEKISIRRKQFPSQG